jgi:Protein kinase domain
VRHASFPGARETHRITSLISLSDMPQNNISVTVSGDFTLDDIEEALRSRFAGRSIRVDRGNGETGNGNSVKKPFSESKESDGLKEIVVSYSPTADQLQYLKVLLERKTKDMKEMEASSSKALLTMQTFQTQQKALLDEFIILHQKYDEQKQALVDILWVDCAKHDPTLKFIPVLQNMNNFVETENSVGVYNMGEELGSGQFAAVRTCWREKDTATEYAIKIIKKERMTTHLSVSRLSDEVGLLMKLQNQYVISIKETFQTQKHMYIITEKGGADMFEFFDEHDDGVPEPWAKDIMACVLISVQACHEAGICHRGKNVLSLVELNKRLRYIYYANDVIKYLLYFLSLPVGIDDFSYHQTIPISFCDIDAYFLSFVYTYL